MARRRVWRRRARVVGSVGRLGARGSCARTLGSPAARRRWPEAELAAYDCRRARGRRPPLARRGRARSGQSAGGRVRTSRRCSAMPAGRRGLFGHGVLCGPLRHVIGVDLDVRRRTGHGRGSTSRRRASRAPCSPPPSATRSGRRSRRPLGRETSAARTSPHSASARPPVAVTPRAAAGQVAHEAPWLVGRAARDGHHRVVRRGARRARPGRRLRCTSATSAVLRSIPPGALVEHPLVVREPRARAWASPRSRRG